MGERGVTGAGGEPDLRPLHAQVKELILRRVAAGEWRPGEALPSEARLAAELGVGQGTVRKALDQMAAQKLLVRRPGRGTFVAKIRPERALFHFFHIVGDSGAKEPPTSRILDLRLGEPDGDEARLLELSAGARVWKLLRLRSLQGSPVIIERIALPADTFPDFSLPVGVELEDELYVLYRQRFGVTVARAQERIRAAAADEFDASYLGVPTGAPILEIDRVARGPDGLPVERRLSRCNTERHRYATEIE